AAAGSPFSTKNPRASPDPRRANPRTRLPFHFSVEISYPSPPVAHAGVAVLVWGPARRTPLLRPARCRQRWIAGLLGNACNRVHTVLPRGIDDLSTLRSGQVSPSRVGASNSFVLSVVGTTTATAPRQAGGRPGDSSMHRLTRTIVALNVVFA